MTFIWATNGLQLEGCYLKRGETTLITVTPPFAQLRFQCTNDRTIRDFNRAVRTFYWGGCAYVITPRNRFIVAGVVRLLFSSLCENVGRNFSRRK